MVFRLSNTAVALRIWSIASIASLRIYALLLLKALSTSQGSSNLPPGGIGGVELVSMAHVC